MAVILAGLIVRLELASFTGHPYDLGVWAYSARLFYESGQFDTHFATLPTLYYVQLAFYSFYVLLRTTGFTDYTFMYHTSYMVEGLFLKLPMILSDLGIFLVILKFTHKLRYATLYFLNPFTIYLSSVWGMYDSVMLLPLVIGFYFQSLGKRDVAGVAFLVSGLVKLFGFVPFGLLVLENVMHRRVREAAVQLVIGTSLTLIVFLPYLATGLEDFFAGSILRFAGLSGVESRGYNALAVLSGARFSGFSPFVWPAMGLVAGSFVFQSLRKAISLPTMLLWTIVAAVLLSVFSQSAPQWLSWPIPLSILYAHVVGKKALAEYSYFFGVAATFLIMTITQTSGYLLTGVPLILFEGIEAYSNSLAVYSVTTVGLLLMLVGYLFLKPPRFKLLEVVVLIGFLYVQSYFWFGVLQVIRVS
jgi:hypothetical protein